MLHPPEPRHAEKVARALALAACGGEPETAVLVGWLDPGLLDALTPELLASVLNSLFLAYRMAGAQAVAAACREGAVWDARQGRMRRFAD